MKYRNTINGVIIDIKSKVKGYPWEKYDPRNTTKKENEEVEKINEIAVEEVDDKTELTKADIMQELDAYGISYNKNSTKKQLIELLGSL